MDLKYFAGHILANTEIGKNLSYLPAKLSKLAKVSESVTIENLLNFEETHVENLFSYDPESLTFKFEHKDNEYLAKANTKVDPLQVKFRAEFIEEHLTQFGLSYVGAIRIFYEDCSFDIKLPGELSYDPASGENDKIWVDGHQINKLIIFVCVLVKAALLGAPSKFIRRLFTVMKPIISKYYQKKELFRWMHTQVKFACIKRKQPPSYAEFLGEYESSSSSVKNYLHGFNLLKEGQIEEILPPAEYFNAISEEPEFKNKEKLSNSSDFLRGNRDDGIPCISPDLDEDTTPSVQEILEDLEKVKKKYEKEMMEGMKKINGLEGVKNKKASTEFFINKSFVEQCPIF